MTDETKSEGNIHIGDHANIIGDVFTGGKHIYQIHRPPLGTPFQAPPLPPHFIPRPEVTNALKARHLADNPTTTPGILVVSAIHGLGGIGKSTLAAALAYDEEVQQHFKDGILWATLGQQPELISLLSAWIQALGDYDFRPTTVNAATIHLRTLLQDKAVLLVVDDVWNPDHGQPFRVGSLKSQVLITTRRADVAGELGAELHQMDVMTPEQALALLVTRLKRSLVGAERTEALALAKEVGYLPLALELATARVARGTTWAELLRGLEAEVARLDVLEGPHRRGSRAKLEASFNLSLHALHAEDETAWQAFVWLGVLPEDVKISSPMAAILWKMEESEASQILELLWNDALLLSTSSILIDGQERGAYRLHDLLHNIARRLLTVVSREGLGLSLPVAHATLLKHYRKYTQNALWHTLPDDGYIHSHLTWHLIQAKQIEQIHLLLQEVSAEGGNGWYQACERLGQTAGFLNDVNLARKLVDEKLDLGQENVPLIISRQIRYALMTTSLNSISHNVPPKLLAALVSRQVWSVAQGITYGRQIPDPLHRAEALVELYRFIPIVWREEVLKEILRAARVVGREQKLVVNLLKLIPQFVESGYLSKLGDFTKTTLDSHYAVQFLIQIISSLPQQIIVEILRVIVVQDQDVQADKLLLPIAEKVTSSQDLVQDASWPNENIADAEQRVRVLINQALQQSPDVRDETLSEVLYSIREIRSKAEQGEVLKKIAPYLSVSQVLEALTIVKDVNLNLLRTEALSDLILRLAEQGDTLRALIITRSFEDQSLRASVLVRLAPYLLGPAREEVIIEALATVQTIESKHSQTKLLDELSAHLPKTWLLKVLVTRQAILDHVQIAETLAALCPVMAGAGYVKETVAAALTIEDKYWKAIAIAGLASYLPDEMKETIIQESFGIALSNEEEHLLIASIIELIPHMSSGNRKTAFREILTTSRIISNMQDRLQVLVKSTLRLAALGFPAEAFVIAKLITWHPSRAEALIKLASHLVTPEIDDLVTLALVTEPAWCRAEILVGIMPHLPETLKPSVSREALAAIQEIGPQEQVQALAKLIPHLTGKSRVTALQHALADTQTIKDLKLKTNALIQLLPLLAEVAPMEAMKIAKEIRDERNLLDIITALIPHLPNGVRIITLREMLKAVRSLKSQHDAAEILVGLASYLQLTQLEEALEIAQGFEYEGDQELAVAGLLPRLGELGKPIEAITFVEKLNNKLYQVEALSNLIPFLPLSLVPRALTLAIHSEIGRTGILNILVPPLAQLPNSTLISLWREILPVLASHTRQDLLADLRVLIPIIVILGGVESIAEVFFAIQENGKWWP